MSMDRYSREDVPDASITRQIWPLLASWMDSKSKVFRRRLIFENSPEDFLCRCSDCDHYHDELLSWMFERF